MSTSAGSGHVRAGEALTKVFEEHPGVSEVLHSDALRFTNKLFRDFYSKLYTHLVKDAPDFLGWWYKQSDEPWKTDGMRLMLDRSEHGAAGEIHPAIQSPHHGLHTLHASWHYFAFDREESPGCASFDRGDRSGLSCNVVVAGVSPLFRCHRRDQGSPRRIGAAQRENHGFRHSD